MSINTTNWTDPNHFLKICVHTHFKECHLAIISHPKSPNLFNQNFFYLRFSYWIFFSTIFSINFSITLNRGDVIDTKKDSFSQGTKFWSDFQKDNNTLINVNNLFIKFKKKKCIFTHEIKMTLLSCQCFFFLLQRRRIEKVREVTGNENLHIIFDCLKFLSIMYLNLKTFVRSKFTLDKNVMSGVVCFLIFFFFFNYWILRFFSEGRSNILLSEFH